MREDYMCPFCVTPWKCNGPHIEPEDMANFNDYVNEWCEAMGAACIRAVEAIPASGGFTNPDGVFEEVTRASVLAALRKVRGYA